MARPSWWSVARAAGVVLPAWLAFYGLQSAIWLSLTPPGSITAGHLAVRILFQALCWTALSFVVAAWHGRLRARTGRLLVLVLGHLPLFVLAILADYGAWQLVEVVRQTGVHWFFWLYVTWTADQSLFAYLGIVAALEVLAARRALAAREQRNRRLASLVNRARLAVLEAQLQPHFLFNVLSALSELACSDPATASRMIDRLIAGLKGAAPARGDEVTLAAELAELDAYLDIQRMRFADWLAISYRVASEARDCRVPRFILQPLVENAIRHGLTGRATRGAIEIAALIEDGRLVLRIADNGVGLHAGGERRGYGIGLANVRQRLEILYGAEAEVRLLTPGAGTIAELRMPARRTAAPAPDAEPAASEVAPAAAAPALRAPAWLRRPGFAIPALWLAAGVFWTQQAYLYLQADGQNAPARLGHIARNNFTSAGLWLLLTPVLLALGTHVVGRLAATGWKLLATAALALGVTVVHVAAFRLILAPTHPWLDPAFQGIAAPDFVIAIVIIAVAQRGQLLGWLRRSDAEAAALAAELAEEERRAERVRGFPPVIAQALESIRATMQRDAVRAESEIAQLGDYLRGALESMAEAAA